jgi:hypothetical protein
MRDLDPFLLKPIREELILYFLFFKTSALISLFSPTFFLLGAIGIYFLFFKTSHTLKRSKVTNNKYKMFNRGEFPIINPNQIKTGEIVNRK